MSKDTKKKAKTTSKKKSSAATKKSTGKKTLTKKTTKKKTGFSLGDYMDVIYEMNDVFGLNPPIPDQDNEKDAIEEIKSSAELMESDDISKFTEKAIKTLKHLEIDLPEAEEESEEEADDDNQDVDDDSSDDSSDDDDDDDDDEEKEDKKTKAKKATKKSKDKKEDKKASTKDKDKTNEKKPKTKKGPSPYGLTVEIMCKKPDMDTDDLKKQLEKAGIDTAESKAAIGTGITTVRRLISMLSANGHTKKKWNFSKK